MANTSVLMTTDAVGGIWTYTLDLGRALVRDGYRVTLAVLGPMLEAPQQEAAAQAGLSVIVTGLRPEWLADDEAEVARAATMFALLTREQRPDILHLNHPALAAHTVFDAPILAACHSCVATWWDAVRGTPLPDDFRWRTDLVARGYRAAPVLVAPTEAFAQATQQFYGLARRPAVIRNGRARNAAIFLSQPPTRSVLTAGRLWDEGKNLTVLDRAAPLIRAPIRAAGPTTGPNGAHVVFDHVEALGSLEEAALLTRFAERPIYVSAALYEPFGLAVLEAAQAGCALVLSDIPTFRELWRDAALFVPPRDERAIATAVNRLLAEPGLRLRMAEAARIRALEYGLQPFANGIAALYRQVLTTETAGKEDAA
jgi:glycosyltransferase involved in cell wall biosynthesis